MADIRIRVDMDGVLADFSAQVMSRLGFSPDSPSADMHAVWGMVSADPLFWQNLPEMADASELWDFVRPYDPSLLTGVGGRAADCLAGKRAWAAAHLGCDKVVVTGVGRKPEFCRAGDILIDDKAENILSWQEAGGFGVLHTGAASTVAALKALGLSGGGVVSPGFTVAAEARRNDRAFKREGYSGYVISPESQRQLVRAFGVREGSAGQNYRLVCQHLTRAFPVGDDTVDNAQPEIEVVGEFFSGSTGHHVLSATVDGETARPDGMLYHVTYALDDTPEAEAFRKESGGKRPTAGESNRILSAAVAAAGGDRSVLFNLGPDRRTVISAEYAVLDQRKLAALPKARPVFTEKVDIYPYTFSCGAPDGKGGVITEGRRTVRLRGDIETVTFDLAVPADGPEGASEVFRKHSDGDLPAIRRRNVRTGEILFEAWAADGKMLKGPPGDTAPAPAP